MRQSAPSMIHVPAKLRIEAVIRASHSPVAAIAVGRNGRTVIPTLQWPHGPLRFEETGGSSSRGTRDLLLTFKTVQFPRRHEGSTFDVQLPRFVQRISVPPKPSIRLCTKIHDLAIV